MKLVTCPHCDSDDIFLQDSNKLDTPITSKYTFVVWNCIFLCHTCGQEFNIDLDADERKDYL